jgi:hypothetical protein
MKRFLLTLVATLAVVPVLVQAQPAAIRPIGYRPTVQPTKQTAEGPRVTIIRHATPTSPPTVTAIAAPVAPVAVTAAVMDCGQGACQGCGAKQCMRPGLLARLGAWFCFRSHGCYPTPSPTPNCTPALATYFLRDCGMCANDHASGAVNPPYRRSVFPVGHFYGAHPTGMPGGGLGTVPGCCSR